jgi:glycosyltransferase involved in cell wall biosynthesis
MATLTVLMPVYNAERFLAAAIDSILTQTFTDFEFLIIDDCSSDNSVNILRSYKDPRILFYQNEKNLGISATLNKGIELASTDLIARMDSDDISYPDRLQKQVDFIADNPDGALYSCQVKVIGQQGQFIRQDNFKSQYYYYNLTFICWIYHPSVIFGKKAVQDVGMYTVRFSEDFELFWQLSRKYKIYNLPEVLLDYRVTDQSLHQVLKKKEYEEAQQQQLLRNFRYYAGERYTIPESFIECLQHNFEPLLLENNIGRIVACLNELDFLTQKILATENVNRDVNAIKEAAFFKRKFILEFFVKHLKAPKGILLLLRLRENFMLERYIKDSIKKIISWKKRNVQAG